MFHANFSKLLTLTSAIEIHKPELRKRPEQLVELRVQNDLRSYKLGEHDITSVVNMELGVRYN